MGDTFSRLVALGESRDSWQGWGLNTGGLGLPVSTGQLAVRRVFRGHLLNECLIFSSLGPSQARCQPSVSLGRVRGMRGFSQVGPRALLSPVPPVLMLFHLPPRCSTNLRLFSTPTARPQPLRLQLPFLRSGLGETQQTDPTPNTVAWTCAHRPSHTAPHILV